MLPWIQREASVGMRDRRKLLIGGAAALLLLSARHPSADIRIVAHDAGDPAPRQVRAAVDLGLLAVSVLVTWTGQRLAR